MSGPMTVVALPGTNQYGMVDMHTISPKRVVAVFTDDHEAQAATDVLNQHLDAFRDAVETLNRNEPF